MKKSLSILAVAVAIASVAGAVWAAGASQNDAGCGLGSQVFKDNDPVHQILAATTNGSFGTQTFGISTGSLGCNGGGLGKSAKLNVERKNFVAANFRNLNREMVAGGGEYVASLSSLMGCSKNASADFAKFTQTHYSELYPKADTTPDAMLDTLQAGISQDAKLSASCTL